MIKLFCLLLALSPILSTAAEEALPKAMKGNPKQENQEGFSLTKLQATYKKASSVTADFTQEVYQASLARTKTSKGSLKISKPNLVRWEIYEPETSVMVSDGHKLSYFTPNARGKDQGQVIEKRSTELERQPIFRILAGSAPLDKDFNIDAQKNVESDAGTIQLTLKPKRKVADIESAQLRVNSKYLIEELILKNQNGNSTKITLQNQELGAKLPAALFQFKAPPGTEVVNN